MTDCKVKCRIINENIVVCVIPKAADFMTVKNISRDVQNICKVKFCSHDNVLWQGDSFEEAKTIEIPICEPILFMCPLRLEFYFTEPIANADDIFVWLDLRYDPVERNQRWKKANENTSII